MSDQPNLSRLSTSILKTLLYYDIFNYPLKPTEIFHFLNTNHTNENDVEHELITLRNDGLVFQFGDFYSVQNKEENIIRRVKGNVEAEKYLKVAKEKGKLIMKFPFVRAVMASGSLSKGYMDEKSDLDFFIVTEPGRLWIARTLLVIYKRIFLLNSHKYFCVNYFVDTEHLEIEEKNLFTATELATVIPLVSGEHYDKLQSTNPWLKDFFPNYKQRPSETVPSDENNVIKTFIEGAINIIFGNFWDKFFMNLMLRRWSRLYKKDYAQDDFSVAFKTKKYASKNHPKHYQRKVMELYQEKLECVGRDLI